MTRSEFVSVGSPEETVLETYFVMLSKLNFDKAREQCVSLIRTPLYCPKSLSERFYKDFYFLRSVSEPSRASQGAGLTGVSSSQHWLDLRRQRMATSTFHTWRDRGVTRGGERER